MLVKRIRKFHANFTQLERWNYGAVYKIYLKSVFTYKKRKRKSCGSFPFQHISMVTKASCDLKRKVNNKISDTGDVWTI